MEKARDLVIKMQFQRQPLDFDQSKVCALVCIDEVLSNIDATMTYHNDSKTLPVNQDYWLRVREEVARL